MYYPEENTNVLKSTHKHPHCFTISDWLNSNKKKGIWPICRKCNNSDLAGGVRTYKLGCERILSINMLQKK